MIMIYIYIMILIMFYVLEICTPALQGTAPRCWRARVPGPPCRRSPRSRPSWLKPPWSASLPESWGIPAAGWFILGTENNMDENWGYPKKRGNVHSNSGFFEIQNVNLFLYNPSWFLEWDEWVYNRPHHPFIINIPQSIPWWLGMNFTFGTIQWGCVFTLGPFFGGSATKKFKKGVHFRKCKC